jgi:hypothetical protein
MITATRRPIAGRRAQPAAYANLAEGATAEKAVLARPGQADELADAGVGAVLRGAQGTATVTVTH